MAEIFQNDTPEGEQGIDKSSYTLSYLVATDPETENEATVISLVLATIPASIPALPTDLLFERISYSHMEAGIYKAEAHYSTNEQKVPEQKEGDDPSFSFDTTGGQEKIWYSRANLGNYGIPKNGNGTDGPDFGGGINVTKDNVEGCEIVVPAFKMPIKKIVPIGLMTGDYIRTLFTLTGTVNDADYTINVAGGVVLTFKRGELRFDGAKGGLRGLGNWDLDFHFTGQANETNLVVGKGTIGNAQFPAESGNWVVTKKLGWDYLWVNFRPRIDPVTNTLVQSPVSIHIERVYKFTNFMDLKL